MRKYVFYHRHKIFYFRLRQNAGHDSLFKLRNARAVYRKNRNAFSDALFYHPDNPAFGQEKNDRMPELQNAISDGIAKFMDEKFENFQVFQLYKLPEKQEMKISPRPAVL